MSELIALIFEGEENSRRLESDLIAAQESQKIKIADAALVVRRTDGRPMFSHAVDLVGRGSMGGIFWGIILSLVFWAKWWGLNVGSALGDLRVDEDFVKDVGEELDTGHSALLALVDESMVAGLLAEADKRKPKVFRTTLIEEDELILKAVFQSIRENE